MESVKDAKPFAVCPKMSSDVRCSRKMPGATITDNYLRINDLIRNHRWTFARMPDNCSHSSERRCAARASVLIFSGKLTPLLLGLQCLLELPPRHQIVWHAIFRSLPQRKRAGNCSQATANLLAPPKKEPQEVSFENSVITPWRWRWLVAFSPRASVYLFRHPPLF